MRNIQRSQFDLSRKKTRRHHFNGLHNHFSSLKKLENTAIIDKWHQIATEHALQGNFSISFPRTCAFSIPNIEQ
jgi:hypothetical protein